MKPPDAIRPRVGAQRAVCLGLRRRPTHMIRQQSTAAEVKVEYEMDEEDEAWLTNLNSRVHMRMLDCNRFEEMVDALERVGNAPLSNGCRVCAISDVCMSPHHQQ